MSSKSNFTPFFWCILGHIQQWNKCRKIKQDQDKSRNFIDFINTPKSDCYVYKSVIHKVQNLTNKYKSQVFVSQIEQSIKKITRESARMTNNYLSTVLRQASKMGEKEQSHSTRFQNLHKCRNNEWLSTTRYPTNNLTTTGQLDINQLLISSSTEPPQTITCT